MTYFGKPIRIIEDVTQVVGKPLPKPAEAPAQLPALPEEQPIPAPEIFTRKPARKPQKVRVR
jgi:hypothetical protein